MKKPILSTLLLLALLGLGATQSMAYKYSHDDKHWYDTHGKAHPLVSYKHHHGYWDSNNGKKVFINLD